MAKKTKKADQKRGPHGDSRNPKGKTPSFHIKVLKHVVFDRPKTFRECRSLWTQDEMQGDGVVLVSLCRPGFPEQLRALSATNELGGICDDCVDRDLMGSMVSGYCIVRIAETWLIERRSDREKEQEVSQPRQRRCR